MVITSANTTEVLLNNSTTADEESAAYGVISRAIKSIQITNSGGSVVKIWKSLYNPSPEGDMVWVQHGDDVLENDIVSIDQAVRFIKVSRGSDTNPVTAIMCSTIPTSE